MMAGLLIAITTPFFTTLIADRMDKEKITVAIIDTTFGGEDFFSLSERDSYKREQIIEALAVALETEADYVVLPEDSRYLNPALAPERAYSFFRFEQGDPRAVVIEAGRVPDEAGAVLRVSIYDGIEKKAYGIDKQYLVPQGEFMPYLYTTTLQFLGGGKTASALEAKLKYRPGPLYEQSKLPKHLPGVLFCFASANPLAVYDLIEERELPFIVHPISHAWFHSPDSLWQQLDVMLKIHAVWNNVPIVSAGNMVEGALYTEAGAKVIGETYARGASWRVSLVSW